MSATVRLADGSDDVCELAEDFAVDENGTLVLLDGPADDEEAHEVGMYLPGWVRVKLHEAT